MINTIEYDCYDYGGGINWFFHIKKRIEEGNYQEETFFVIDFMQAMKILKTFDFKITGTSTGYKFELK